MKMMNNTKCITSNGGCLVPGICCYECDHKGWCDIRCINSECRREQVKKRLKTKMKLNNIM